MGHIKGTICGNCQKYPDRQPLEQQFCAFREPLRCLDHGHCTPGPFGEWSPTGTCVNGIGVLVRISSRNNGAGNEGGDKYEEQDNGRRNAQVRHHIASCVLVTHDVQSSQLADIVSVDHLRYFHDPATTFFFYIDTEDRKM